MDAARRREEEEARLRDAAARRQAEEAARQAETAPPPAPARERALYDLLGASPDAAPSDLKKAFRKACLKHHPDKGGDAATFQQARRPSGARRSRLAPSSSERVLSDDPRRRRGVVGRSVACVVAMCRF